ncbi:MAG: FAD-dependent monooxygenase [Pseudomonadota bacterium]
MAGASKVLIVGGGIGGLTAALACARAGMQVELFERALEFGEVGAGLQIPPNAMKVLRALGAAGRVSRDAVRPTALQMRFGQSGRFVFDVPLGAAAERRWGAPYLHIHRADYIEALRDLVAGTPGITLHLGHSVTGLASTEACASLRLADGMQVTGDVIVGADGLHSVVRDWLHGDDSPIYTGNMAWRATVPAAQLEGDAPEAAACVWVGAGRHAVTYRLRGGAMANLVGVVEVGRFGQSPREGWMQAGDKADALSDFKGWHPTVRRILEAVPNGALFRWPLYDRKPLPFWSRGRVTLLGDAAHPMLPFMAQGAAMATEDAWVLARELSRDVPVPEALAAYEAARLPRSAKVQAASRANMTTFHRRTLLSQLATYGPMHLAGRFAPRLVRRRLDWLYGFDAVDP